MLIICGDGKYTAVAAIKQIRLCQLCESLLGMQSEQTRQMPFFLPISLQSTFIVLFLSNGPVLNLLDPFHFTLKAECKCAPLRSTARVGRRMAALLCVITNTSRAPLQFFLHSEPKRAFASSFWQARTLTNCKIDGRAYRRENLGEWHLDVPQVMWWRTKRSHLFTHTGCTRPTFDKSVWEGSECSILPRLPNIPKARLLTLRGRTEYLLTLHLLSRLPLLSNPPMLLEHTATRE